MAPSHSLTHSASLAHSPPLTRPPHPPTHASTASPTLPPNRFSAEHEDAGSFFADLGKKPDELRAWREEHRSLWDVDWEDKDYDPRQPASRALAHLLELLVYSVEALVFEMDNPGKKLPKIDACVQLSSRKIDKWCKEKAKDKPR